MAKPEMENVWTEEKAYFLEGKRVLMKDKRKILGNIEERIQVFAESDTAQEIKTIRRYMGKQEIDNLLVETGFTEIKFSDGYNASGFHKLSSGEDTASSYMVMAQKP